MDYNLPIEIVNENLDHVPKVVNSIDDIKKRFKQFIDDGNTIEKQIENSKALCEEAEYMVESAKSYNNAWYKIGSDKKKMRLMAESQEGMAKAITNLQQGQALLFKYQKTLSFFCIACLYFVHLIVFLQLIVVLLLVSFLQLISVPLSSSRLLVLY